MRELGGEVTCDSVVMMIIVRLPVAMPVASCHVLHS